jgi:heme/copper-type cytochrome/quinol oxidase subunit 2
MACGATLQGLAGCQDQLSTLHPAGPAAEAIAEIWWIMLVGSVAILVLVLALLTAAVLRRPPPPPAASAAPDRDPESERLLPREDPDLVTVTAEARQWAWTFGYPDAPGLSTDRVLHIPAGRPVDVQITSRDVVHSFWVPRLAGKLDALPGHVNVLRIEAPSPGTYAGQTAEFNGRGYAEHVFTVQAHDPAAWSRFLQEGPP